MIPFEALLPWGVILGVSNNFRSRNTLLAYKGKRLIAKFIRPAYDRCWWCHELHPFC